MPKESTRPCSCDGSNENCSRCFGRGFITTTPIPHTGNYFPKPVNLSEPAPMKAARGIPPPSPTDDIILRCPRCRFRGTVDALVRHFAQRHRPARQNVCPCCGCHIRPERLKTHLRKVHRENKSQKPRRHSSQAKRGEISRTSGKADRHDRWKKTVESAQSPLQPNLDATRLYAHRYREKGRYGSHPSHDGFDDESSS
jgi:hypothetical protein